MCLKEASRIMGHPCLHPGNSLLLSVHYLSNYQKTMQKNSSSYYETTSVPCPGPSQDIGVSLKKGIKFNLPSA